MLVELSDRYHRPIIVSETGAEAGSDIGCLGYMHAEVRQAQRQGAQILGLCIYPVMDYVGWDDQRHCPCGLIEVTPDWQQRRLRPGLVAEVLLQESMRRISSEMRSPSEHDSITAAHENPATVAQTGQPLVR